MQIVKLILAIVAIIISAVFIVACLAGVVFSWSVNTPTTNAITGALTGVERVLTAADNGLERVNTRLAEAQTNVDTIEERVETAGETLSETSVVYQVLDRTVGDELFPKVAAAGETIVTIRDSVVAFNETLESLNGIPFVEVPTLTENLETAAQRMETVQSDVEETRAELRAIKEEAISKPVTAITDRTTRISDGLEAAQTALSSTQVNIDDNLESIADIRDRVPGLIDLISIVLSFIFIWIALGQVGLIVLAWGVVKSSDESKEATDAVISGTEE
jgi:peptidoglycan hydrolase CwlO-like protein